MPYTTAEDGVRLYYEVAGSGPPVLLITGAFSSLEDWQESGVFDELARDRRVVAMDLRGHGRGDKPHDAAAYGWPRNAADALAVLGAVDAHNTDVYGFSMGGQVAVAMLHGDTSRLRSVAAMGVYVPPPGFEPPAPQLVERVRILRERGLVAESMSDLMFGVDEPPSAAWLERALSGDVEAYIAEAEAQAAMRDQQMPPAGPPTLLAAAEHDALAVALCAAIPQRCAYARYQLLPGVTHMYGISRGMTDVLRAFWAAL